MARVWALTGARVGDNAQVMRLAEALGLETQQIPLAYNAARLLPNWLLGASLAALSSSARGALQPPWPDLVISCGVRNEPVCRGIRAQSGGRTRYVHVGRPWADLDSFDLVVTTPQYRVPPRRNVVNNLLTHSS